MSQNEPETLWSLRKKGSQKVYSKIPFPKVKAWILEGRIDPDDLLSKESGQWVSAASIAELAAFFAPDSLGAEVISSEDVGFAWRDKENQEEEVAVDMTSMIDVTFLLLIFFMVTATFAINQTKDVRVPSSSSTVSNKPEKILVVVDSEEKISVCSDKGTRAVRIEELQAFLKEEVQRTRQEDIMVAGDRSIRYDFFIRVLDCVSHAGIQNIKLKLKKE